MTVKVFITFFVAEILSSESSSIKKAITESNWYLCDKNSQRVIYLILIRAQKALEVNAGIFGVLNLRGFKDFIFRAYSFLTVLHSLIKLNK